MPAATIRQLDIYERRCRHPSADSGALGSLLTLGIVAWFVLLVSAAPAEANRSDRRSFAHLFGESIAPGPLEACRVSQQLPREESYRFLLNYVFPPHSDKIRLTIGFLPANPSPPVVDKYGAVESLMWSTKKTENRISSGGSLISPVIELVRVAGKLGKLDELREKLLQLSPTEHEQIKSQLSLEILIDWEHANLTRAGQSLTRLLSLVRESPATDPERVPEMLVIWCSLSSPETLNQAYDLLYVVHGYGVDNQTHDEGTPRNERFKRHISALKFQIDQRLSEESGPDSETPKAPRLNDWHPVSRQLAKTRGIGFPNATWIERAGFTRKVSTHDDDYLYFAIPLRGEFEIEADLSTFSYQEVRLAMGNHWVGPNYTLKECERGNFRRHEDYLSLDPPLSKMDERMRARVVVKDGLSTTSINGRKIFARPYGSEDDPWLAVYSPWYAGGIVENLRITGAPNIPREIDLIANAELPGWLPYYEESAGAHVGDWQLLIDESGAPNVLIGRSHPELRGALQESLLRYHRPMFEDGVIEYEFFYKEGEYAVYPALDRCCFLFDDRGAGIHWLTDGRYDRTGPDPANFISGHGDRPLPLNGGEWNRVKLTLRGDVVEIALNGQPIFTHKLEPENQRTFGLFHYADQSEARVRNLRWRGEWPRRLPSVANQELADDSLEQELNRGPELPVVFEHDFSKGLPPEKIWGGGSEGWHLHSEQTPEGVRITRGSGSYSHYALSLPIRLEGDFDMTFEFEDFRCDVAGGGEGDVQVEVCFEDEKFSDCRVYRKHYHRKDGTHEDIVQAAIFEQRERNTQHNWPAQLSEESNAGRLRLVRRGAIVYFLYAANDSPNFRLIHRQKVTDAPVDFGGIKAIVETHLEGESSAIWKRAIVRSEYTPQLAERAETTIAQLDEQREELSAAVKYDFNQQTPADQIQIWGTADHLLKQDNDWLVKEPGAEEWTACGFASRVGLNGDFDVTLNLEVVKLEEPVDHHESYFLFKTRLNYPIYRDVELKLSQTSKGKQELIMQRNTGYRNGSMRYEKIKIQPSGNVTRFRLARRGEVLYWIYRTPEDSRDQIFGNFIIGTNDVSPGSLLTMFRTGGEGKETVVRLKSMSMHAERLLRIDTGP